MVTINNSVQQCTICVSTKDKHLVSLVRFVSSTPKKVCFPPSSHILLSCTKPVEVSVCLSQLLLSDKRQRSNVEKGQIK